MNNEPQLDSGDTKLPVAPALIREAALQELAILGPFVEKLSPVDWTKPSAVDGWAIGEVVAHLTLAMGVYSRVLDAAFKGWGGGSAWKTFGRLTEKVAPMASPAFNAINSAIPRVLEGALAPEVIKGQFAAAVRGLRERLERVDPGDYTHPIHYMGRPWPLSFFLAAVVNELAVHGWDMASKLDPEAHLSEGARQVLPGFYWGATPFMFHPPATARGTVQALLVDPSFAAWWGLDPQRARQGMGDLRADVTIRGESGTFVLILAGRIPVEDALRTTSITVEGNRELGPRFLGGWKIT